MNKKFLGIKISTIMTLLVCFLCAVLLWVYVAFLEDEGKSSDNTAEVVYTEVAESGSVL